MYYNPQVTYAPAKLADGTILKNFEQQHYRFGTRTEPGPPWPATHFPSGTTCDNYYNVGNYHDYYVNGGTTVRPQLAATSSEPNRGTQDCTNQYVKNWYGAAGS